MTFQRSLTLSGPASTESFGKELGRLLKPGSILLFHGDMGSGKTTLIKSICTGLGVQSEVVISPTYTLVNRYAGKQNISHVDLFRLVRSEELQDFDREDLICEEGITLVEWPKLIIGWLEKDPLLHIRLEYREEQVRFLEMESDAPHYTLLFERNMLKDNASENQDLKGL